jgi:hypothetical protein
LRAYTLLNKSFKAYTQNTGIAPEMQIWGGANPDASGNYFAWLAVSGFTATMAGAMIMPIKAIAIRSSCMGESPIWQLS